jgi:hypothetical protein
LVVDETYVVVVNRSKNHRRFEGQWLKEEKINDIVSTAWTHTHPSVAMMSKMSSLQSELHKWDKTVLKAPQKKIKDLPKKLDNLLSGTMNDETTQQQKEITRKIEAAL